MTVGFKRDYNLDLQGQALNRQTGEIGRYGLTKDLQIECQDTPEECEGCRLHQYECLGNGPFFCRVA